MATAEPQITTITKPEVETIAVPIIGTAPLICHRFADKAKRQMLDNMQGRKSHKEVKDPDQEYQDAFYRFADGPGYGMPAIAFKAATVGGVRFFGKAITMTAFKQYAFFKGERGADGQALVRIHGEPHMREDVVRVGRGGADLRYRPEFTDWSAELVVTFVNSVIKQESLLSLIEAGGMGVGVGEWRPERDGDMGTYEIDETRETRTL